MACPRCGSWSVRADRSLAGRMVCGRCGTPLQGVQRGGRRRPPRRRVGLWLGMLGVLALAATLAVLTPEPRQPLIRERPADPPLDRWR